MENLKNDLSDGSIQNAMKIIRNALKKDTSEFLMNKKIRKILGHDDEHVERME